MGILIAVLTYSIYKITAKGGDSEIGEIALVFSTLALIVLDGFITVEYIIEHYK